MGKRSTLRRLAIRFSAVAAGAALCATAFTACSAEPQAQPGTQNDDPVPTATVPAPNGGSVEETVAPVDPGPTQDAELGESADLDDGVSITVSEVEPLEVEANTPGEIAGPAVALTINVDNASDETIDLSTAMVSVTGSGGSYGQATTSEPFSPFMGSVEPGAAASGVYVFRLPAQERDALQVSVEYVAGAPIALFVGSVE
ncbi:DUF4352 domain-containing protein [Micromonospora sp. DT81.3]|uniref:DUF4352 domain-containing protein n=1 Tax=Actinomycetes TaxID=1760 RepID=UPI003CF68791